MKIGDKEVVKPGDVKEIKKVDSPTTGASEDESSEASVEQRPSSETSEATSVASDHTTKKGKDKTEEGPGVSKRSKKEFYENTVIGQGDVGKTLLNKLKETDTSADKVTELSPTEEKFLDDMIFKGFVSHTIYLRKGFPVSFRSCSPLAMQNGFDVLNSHNSKGQEKLSNLYTCMTIAVYLEEYGVSDDDGNLYASYKNQGNEEFSSKESIEKRFDFCSKKLNGVSVDIISDRLGEFLSLLSRIGRSRNVLNF